MRNFTANKQSIELAADKSKELVRRNRRQRQIRSSK